MYCDNDPISQESFFVTFYDGGTVNTVYTVYIRYIRCIYRIYHIPYIPYIPYYGISKNWPKIGQYVGSDDVTLLTLFRPGRHAVEFCPHLPKFIKLISFFQFTLIHVCHSKYLELKAKIGSNG